MASMSLRRRSAFYFRRRFCSDSTPEAASPSPPPSAYSVRRNVRFEQNPDAILKIISPLSGNPSEAASVAARDARDIAVIRLSKHRRTSDIETLLESVKKHYPHTENPESFLSGIIVSYGKAGMVEHAIRAFDELESHGVRPSVLSFNCLLSACAQGKGFEKVPSIFRDVLNRYPDISPDKASYNLLAKSLCETGSPEEARSLLKEMEDKGLGATAVVYTTILHGFYKNNNAEKGDEIWDEMLEKGAVDSAAYNAKIFGIARCGGSPEEILELLDQMGRRGLKPNVLSYNSLMACYCKNGRLEEGKKVYKELKKKGCSPNAATFRTLLFYLSQSDDLDTAMKILKVSLRKKKVPGYPTMQMLAEAFAKASRKADVKWLMEKMKKVYFDSNLDSWIKLEASLGLVEEEEGKETAPDSVVV